MALVGTLNSAAQITITNFHAHDIGITETYREVPDLTIDLTQAGENQTWDASSVIFEENETFIGLSPDNLPNSDLFPEATMARNVNGFNVFFRETQTELNYLGLVDEGNGTAIYSDPVTRMMFPMNYGDSYMDNFEATFIFDNPFFDPGNLSGSIESSADAYGVLILPYGSIENTIRTKEVETNLETAVGKDDFSYTRTVYTWYDSEYGSRIAYLVEFQINGSQDVEITFTYLSQEDYTSITEQEETSNLQVYPNPASEYFQISGTESGSEYLLINQQGQEVLSGFLAGDERIDTSEFTSGIYFLEIKNDQGVSRKKISIQ